VQRSAAASFALRFSAFLCVSAFSFIPTLFSFDKQPDKQASFVHRSPARFPAGINFPVFLARTVYDSFVTVPQSVTGQDEAGRLWDLVWLTRMAIIRARCR